MVKKHNKNNTNYQRHEADHYPTEPGAVKVALKAFKSRLTYTPQRILDVGCGKGVWGAEAKRLWPSAFVAGIDIMEYPTARDVLDELIIDNYLAWLPQNYAATFDTFIGNPPYKDDQAEYFLRHTLDVSPLEDHGICLLYRMAFYSSGDRIGKDKILRVNPPDIIHQFTHRLSFIESGPKAGETDTDEYGAFVWYYPRSGEVETILKPLDYKAPSKKTLDRKTEMAVVPKARQLRMFDDDAGQPEVTTEVTSDEIEDYLSRVAAAGKGVAV